MFEEHINLLCSDEGETDNLFEEHLGKILHNFDLEREEMEDKIFRTLSEVMEDRTAKPADRIKAAIEAAEILQMRGKGNTTVVAHNAQINNNILEQKPELHKALKSIGAGMKMLEDATDSDVRAVRGGAGS